MTKTVSAAEMKSHLADYIRRIESGDSVVITRHGKPVAALVPAKDLVDLERLRAAGPKAGLAGLAGGWEGSQALVEEISKQRRSRPRSGPRLG